MSIQYHSSLPENTKDSYSPFDTIDFVIYPEGRALQLNKIRLCGDVELAQAGQLTLVANRLKDIAVDHMVGAHSFIDQIQTEFMGGSSASGVVEILNDYPRYVKMVTASSNDEADMVNASHSCELKSPFPEYSRALICGKEAPKQDTITPATSEPTDTTNGVCERNLDFSLKLENCLNRASGNTRLDVSKTGAIKVSILLNRVQNALQGSNCDSTLTYSLKNLRMLYCSTEVQPSQVPTLMSNIYSYKQSIQSSFANIQSKVPAICSAVSLTFNKQSREGDFVESNTDLTLVPNVSEVVFSFNDSTNSLVSYSIKDREEYLRRYLESMSFSHKGAKLNKVYSNKTFGVGLDFRDRVDLTTQKFNTQITSDISSADPYVVYLYFHSLMSV